MQLIKTVTRGWHMWIAPKTFIFSSITSRILHRCVKYQGNKSFICLVCDIHPYCVDAHTHTLHFLSTTAMDSCLVHYIAWHDILHTLDLMCTLIYTQGSKIDNFAGWDQFQLHMVRHMLVYMLQTIYKQLQAGTRRSSLLFSYSVTVQWIYVWQLLCILEF